MGGVVTASSANYLAAEFTSDTFGFVDDMEFRRAADASSSCLITAEEAANCQYVVMPMRL